MKRLCWRGITVVLILLAVAITSTSYQAPQRWRTASSSSLQPRRWGALFSSATPASDQFDSRPILVVGATGQVGRLVVQQLLGQGRPVRALVRNAQKAQEIFGTSTGLAYPPLEIVVADVARYEKYGEVLDRAVNGCSAIISVMGTVRFSKWTDFFPPWRLFRWNVSAWMSGDDGEGHSRQANSRYDHPYYGNYLGQVYLLQLAQKHGCRRFVRLTGLGLANSAFHPFSILFNTLLSFNNRWGILCEQALADPAQTVPYVVLRPGGLASLPRNVSSTYLQVDPSGKLPYPGRIGRTDVAALSIAALDQIPPDKSYTLACRWCGPDVAPRPQGVREDGYATATECIMNLVQDDSAIALPPPKMKPYGLAVGAVVYSAAAVILWIGWAAWHLPLKLWRG